MGTYNNRKGGKSIEDCIRCRAGTYSSKKGRTSECSDLCSAGYYCNEGSISPTENECGNSTVYCPAGSSHPITVDIGYYTTPLNQSLSTRSSQSICERGSYCIDGLKYLCSSGHYGDEEGLSESECSGLCSAGYYCNEGSISPTENECGNSTVYCPAGSSHPKFALQNECTLPFTTHTTRSSVGYSTNEYLCYYGSYLSFLPLLFLDPILISPFMMIQTPLSVTLLIIPTISTTLLFFQPTHSSSSPTPLSILFKYLPPQLFIYPIIPSLIYSPIHHLIHPYTLSSVYHQ